jgi:hypothetical protein
MPLGVHALLICIIVNALCLIAGHVSCACARQAAEQQTCSSPYTRSVAAINGSACNRAHCGTQCRAAHAAIDSSLIGRGSLKLKLGVLAARKVIRPELVESLSGTR